MTPAKFTLALGIGLGIFFAGYMANRQPAPVASAASARHILYYACPMHPQYRSDHPGDAPCCGMRLEPVYADSNPGGVETALAKGIVEVGASRQQLIGVQTAEVRREPSSQALRVPGRIAADDSRLYRLIAASDGWIRELGPNTAGTFVRKDEVLASYYVRDFLAAQQTLIYTALNSDLLQRGELVLGPNRPPANLNHQLSIDSLRSLGMSDVQIDEVQRTHKYADAIRINSPASGFVIARNISPGQRFDKGFEFYRIADISHIWVLTDIFEKDQQFVKSGATATVRYQGREWNARLSDVLPQFDQQSRTLKTRFELDNPGYVLRPDVFVDVDLRVNMPPAIAVPADAVIDTGRRKTVYVEQGKGWFEPRQVETGWRLGDRVEIRSGLEPGERVVVAGNFLIDSESRMRLAGTPAAPVPGAAATLEKDPVCGMDVDPNAPKVIKTGHDRKSYFFCSDHCKRAFEANPAKYVPDANGRKQ